MKKIIYSKYSNERSKNFRIRTSIIQEKNTRTVEKIALNEESKEHINNIYNNYMILSNRFYLRDKVKINRCKMIDDKVVFEYIDGKTLDEIIKYYISINQYELAIDKLREFIELMNYTAQQCEFKITDEFKSIFGNIKIDKNTKASKVSNIDTIFNNIIINDYWNIIDYEWVFKFPIPINYIIYRAINIYNVNNSKHRFNENIYSEIGINDVEIKLYEEMENNFQKYVQGDTTTTDKIYNNIGTVNHDIQNIIDNNKSYEMVCYIKDFKLGIYTEESTIRKKICSSLINEKIDISKFHNLSKLRIDPIDSNCIIDSVEIYAIINNKKIDIPIKYTNCDIRFDNKYLFKTNDPQIFIEITNDNINELFIKYNIIDYDNKLIDESIDLLLRMKEEKDRYISEVEFKLEEKDRYISEVEFKLEEKDRYINEINIKLQERNNYINDIESSRSWKLIQNIKRIIGK